MKTRLILLSFLFIAFSCHAQVQWVAYSGELPENVVVGGRENGTYLAVCRASHDGNYHAGKVVAGNCNYGWGGQEIVASTFEVLVNNGGFQLTWEPFSGTIPRNAVQAGAENGQPNWVGQADRAEDESGHPGKIIGMPGSYQFNYGYGGAEVVVQSNFRILIARPITPLVWVPYDGTLPDAVVNGGKENGSNLAVCRGEYKGATHPGKMVGGKCNIGFGGKEIELTNFEVLTNNGAVLVWRPFTGKIPKGAVQAGVEKGKKLYVGQITRPDGTIHSGKILGSPGAYIFNYGYGGKEVTAKTQFRILIEFDTGGK